MSDGALRQLLLRARTTLRAAATALTPYPLMSWLAGGQEATAARVAEVAVGAGSAGVAIKASAAVLAAGAVVAGGPALRGDHQPARAKAASAAPRPIASRCPARRVLHTGAGRAAHQAGAQGGPVADHAAHTPAARSSSADHSGHGSTAHRSGSSGSSGSGSDGSDSESSGEHSGSGSSGSDDLGSGEFFRESHSSGPGRGRALRPGRGRWAKGSGDVGSGTEHRSGSSGKSSSGKHRATTLPRRSRRPSSTATVPPPRPRSLCHPPPRATARALRAAAAPVTGAPAAAAPAATARAATDLARA